MNLKNRKPTPKLSPLRMDGLEETTETPQKAKMATRAAAIRMNQLAVLQSLSIVSEVNCSKLEETPEKQPTIGAEAYVEQPQPVNLMPFKTTNFAKRRCSSTLFHRRRGSSGQVSSKTTRAGTLAQPNLRSHHGRGKSLHDPLFITTLQQVDCESLSMQQPATGSSTQRLNPTEKLFYAADPPSSHGDVCCVSNDQPLSTLPAYPTLSTMNKRKSGRYSELTQDYGSSGQNVVILELSDSSNMSDAAKSPAPPMGSAAQPYWEFDSSYTSSNGSGSSFLYSTNPIQLELIRPQQSTVTTAHNYNPCQSYQSSMIDTPCHGGGKKQPIILQSESFQCPLLKPQKFTTPTMQGSFLSRFHVNEMASASATRQSSQSDSTIPLNEITDGGGSQNQKIKHYEEFLLETEDKFREKIDDLISKYRNETRAKLNLLNISTATATTGHQL